MLPTKEGVAVMGKHPANLIEEDLKEMYYEQKMSVDAIAIACKVSNVTVLKYMKKHNLPRRSIQEAHKYAKALPNVDWAIKRRKSMREQRKKYPERYKRYDDEHWLKRKRQYAIDPKYRKYVLEQGKKWRRIFLERNKQAKAQLIQVLGGKCAICGFSNPLALDIHHKNGNAEYRRRTFGHGGYTRTFYLKMLERIEAGKESLNDLRLLCANCHRILHATRLEAPISCLS